MDVVEKLKNAVDASVAIETMFVLTILEKMKQTRLKLS